MYSKDGIYRLPKHIVFRPYTDSTYFEFETINKESIMMPSKSKERIWSIDVSNVRKPVREPKIVDTYQ
jgi:hypothetical protein